VNKIAVRGWKCIGT